MVDEYHYVKPHREVVPIPYHLASDPVHMQLLEICKQDVEVLEAEREKLGVLDRRL